MNEVCDEYLMKKFIWRIWAGKNLKINLSYKLLINTVKRAKYSNIFDGIRIIEKIK